MKFVRVAQSGRVGSVQSTWERQKLVVACWGDTRRWERWMDRTIMRIYSFIIFFNKVLLFSLIFLLLYKSILEK